ncbi:MAG: transporter substrate-binding domain-containing protein [Lachnospiraceae bacterium]|nr:transporter substrate-binding domain-containing protein [Lachnospiraceae bacterium]
MRKWKKMMTAVMVGTMAVMTLAGCTSQTTDTPADTVSEHTESDAAETVADDTSDGTALTLDQIKANGKLVVATEAAYEPFEYLDTDGETIIGYNADLFELICEDLGVELDYLDVPFQGILAGLEAKKYDVVGATLGITAERAGKYDMTYPIQKGTNVFTKRKGDDSIQTPADIEGKIVGTQTSCYNETDTKNYNDKLIADGGNGYAELKTYDGFPEAYMELKNGKVDIVAQNYASAAAIVKNNPDDYELVLDENGDVAMVSESDTWLSWAVRKTDTELFDYINNEIVKFKEDGTLDKLQEKWFGQTVELPESDYIPAE